MNKNLIAKVALPLPVYSLFDYVWTESSKPLQLGIRVKVKVKNRICVGIVLGIAKQSEIENLKAIIECIDSDPIISDEILAICRWASGYYHHPIGNVVMGVLPKLLRQGNELSCTKETIYKISKVGISYNYDTLKGYKQKKLLQLLKKEKILTRTQMIQEEISAATLKKLVELGLIYLEEKEINYISNIKIDRPLKLNTEQEAAVSYISRDLNSFHTYLLYGVTGSGKTEIYMHLIQKILDQGKQVLVLVPEIGLTPQMLYRLQRRFSIPIGIFTSNLSDRQKLDAWTSTVNRKIKLLVGTRSALFTPMPDLGLIVVDEEHDSSYKQTERFRYNARDLSIIMAKNLNIPVILGSATPSLESLKNVIDKKYHLIELTTRANQSSMPRYKFIDMKNTFDDVSDELMQNIELHLSQKSQILLFLNRRGFATVMLCPLCGWTAKCHSCDTNFTYHKRNNILMCHKCLTRKISLKQCPKCKLANIKPIGMGTEKLAEIMQTRFPSTKIVRIDQDTTRSRHSFNSYLEDINSGSSMILIGTQMLAKGHHFSNVTMVGILGADNGLYSSDFHAVEKLGQTITQVAGRSGRESKSGIVFIQTHNPNSEILNCLRQNNYKSFLEMLLNERESTNLPPCSTHALFLAESSTKIDSEKILVAINKILQKQLQKNIQVFGPFPAISEKSNGKYRNHLLVQSQSRGQMQKMLQKIMPMIAEIKLDYKSRWILDVDPIDII
ncbi:MAG: primosomal protein N' [Legionellales bacterium]|nr:primosomal protein N' [Legionellales bacterium]